MSDGKERQMIDHAKEAEKAAGPKTIDKPADNPTTGDHEADPADAKQNKAKKI